MKQIIHNCYDSHTHFWATGQVSLGLKLNDLKSADEVKNLIIKPEHFRELWITGFGWDQNNWHDQKFPTSQQIDLIFPDVPVFFSRVDGHASWINTKAKQVLTEKGFDFQSTQIKFDGVLFDQDHIKALSLLPAYRSEQNLKYIQESQNIFNQAGFTHIRDLSMNRETWNLLVGLNEKKELSLCIDSFITAESLNDLDHVIKEIEEMKKNPCSFLKMHGVKIFVDGSLGSKTAYLSENYLQSEHQGLFLWPQSDIKDLMKKVWMAGHDLAIHTIGDQAVHEVIQIARQVSAEGILGRLHLEHVQILRPETIQLMKPLHVTCYLQPTHWLSDEKWMSQVIPASLLKFQFQWELLRKNKIPFYFGSDSPIEKPSLLNTQKAIKESSKKLVPQLMSDWKLHHSHFDKNWAPSVTEFEEGAVVQVIFNNKKLF